MQRWRRVSFKRAISGMAAGLAALAIFSGALWSIWMYVRACISLFGPTCSDVYFFWIILAAALAVTILGLTMPARVLGASWRRSFAAAASSLGIVLLVPVILFLIVLPIFLTRSSLQLISLIVVGIPTLDSIFAVSSRKNVVVAVVIGAVSLGSAAALLIILPGYGTNATGWIIAAASWPMLPAVASALLREESWDHWYELL